MKIAILGTGAIGGLIGARLALAFPAHHTHQISAYARGANLSALREHGWRLQSGEQLLQTPVYAASDKASELGPQDVLIIAVKAPALAELAAQIAPMLQPETLIVPAMNGVPWWLLQGIPEIDPHLSSIDPDHRIAQHLPLNQVAGCVVHASSTVTSPGVIRHVMGQGLLFGLAQSGNPPVAMQHTLQELTQVLVEAGFEASQSNDIRRDIWYKLWGNLTMNPVSALTGATIDKILDDPLLREFCSAAMREAAQIGRAIGCELNQDPEQRHAVTRKLGAFKTSMLQDVAAGRTLEIDSLVSAVHEIAAKFALPVPMISALLGLVRVFARERGLYQ